MCLPGAVQVLGNMKGVIAAGISIALFKNPVTAKGMMGYFITVCGVLAYSEVSMLQLACGLLTVGTYIVVIVALACAARLVCISVV